MNSNVSLTSAQIRAARAEGRNLRARELAQDLGISEARLLAADIETGEVVRITAALEQVMPEIERLGEVMALTRNESCVIEKVGEFADFRPGPHAALVLNNEIDLRMFPKHWVHGFAVEAETKNGTRRSLQFFDAAGEAIFKVFLRETSNHDAWAEVVDTLRLDDQSDEIAFGPSNVIEPAKSDPEKADKLREEWDKLTDTHQFLIMVRRLKMNRLGAYRIADLPYARKLENTVIREILDRAAADAIPIMFFVGNHGCIEIHTGPIETVKKVDNWLNVLDPRFNLHLREDHVAEVWAVTKPTRAGDAFSVEAFDKDGMIILQIFGVLRHEDKAAGWNALVKSLKTQGESE